MAIDSETARLLLAGYRGGASFEKVLMLGRQNYILRPAETAVLFKDYEVAPPSQLMAAFDAETPPFAEPFFASLGSELCDSTDVAAYERATIIHDMNEPVPESLVEQYDIVFDGGTLEHVFHFTQGLHNAMRMTKIGGWFFASTPGNNWFGHGFYQFSPEIFYRSLSPANGFSGCVVFVVPEGLGLNWHRVVDPVQSGTRTNLINSLRTPMMVAARKTASTPDRLRLQQSDYANFWKEDKPVLNTGKTSKRVKATAMVIEKLYALFPRFARRLATLDARSWHPDYTVSNARNFIPIDKRNIAEVIKRTRNSQNL